MKRGISGKTNFFWQLNHLFPVKINRTYVMAASHHHGSVTTSVDLCVQKINELDLNSSEPDHWRAYCIARNKASNGVKAVKKKHLISVQAKVLADPNCSSSKWWRVAKEICVVWRHTHAKVLYPSSCKLVCWLGMWWQQESRSVEWNVHQPKYVSGSIGISFWA